MYRGILKTTSGLLLVALGRVTLSLVTATPSGLVERGNVGQGVAGLVNAVRDYLKDDDAYSPRVPNKCILTMSTSGGTNCLVKIKCGKNNAGEQVVQPYPWNVCYRNGRQFLSHPDIGDFSITFRGAGGENSDLDGLHHPILQLKNFNNWEEWNIDEIIKHQGGADQGDNRGNLCQSNALHEPKTWWCGLPKLGGGAAFGIQLMPEDDPKPGFKGGWCTAHVVQYQRNEFGVGPRYQFDVRIFDDEKKQIGHISHVEEDDNGKASVSSRLPYTFEIKSNGGDDVPLTFSYGDQTWTCDDGNGGGHLYTIGDGAQNGYESGNREGDMGWHC